MYKQQFFDIIFFLKLNFTFLGPPLRLMDITRKRPYLIQEAEVQTTYICLSIISQIAVKALIIGNRFYHIKL